MTNKISAGMLIAIVVYLGVVCPYFYGKKTLEISLDTQQQVAEIRKTQNKEMLDPQMIYEKVDNRGEFK